MPGLERRAKKALIKEISKGKTLLRVHLHFINQVIDLHQYPVSVILRKAFPTST